jgi:hypothetical protein
VKFTDTTAKMRLIMVQSFVLLEKHVRNNLQKMKKFVVLKKKKRKKEKIKEVLTKF